MTAPADLWPPPVVAIRLAAEPVVIEVELPEIVTIEVELPEWLPWPYGTGTGPMPPGWASRAP